MSAEATLSAWRAHIEAQLAPSLRPAPARLVDAIKYSLLGGGKRLRPLLVASSAAAVRGAGDRFVDDALPACLAVEYVHTYSLIHDDLPALDNDDVRRGKPSLHKAFDEATAILAGDALLTDAFALIAAAPVNAAAQVRELAAAAGSSGMVGGQFDDVGGVKDVDALADVHARKTGCLFVAACATGGWAAGASADVVEQLRAFARSFGLAFQIADDVLDVTTGRGRDEQNARATFATFLGVDGAKQRAREEAENARALAASLGAPILEELARFSAARDH